VPSLSAGGEFAQYLGLEALVGIAKALRYHVLVSVRYATVACVISCGYKLKPAPLLLELRSMAPPELVISTTTIERYTRDGFAFVESPLTDEFIDELRIHHDRVMETWAETSIPDGVHKLALQFAALGECVFALPERDDFIAAAKTLLGKDEVFVGCVGAGDWIKTEAADGRPSAQLQWHCAPGRDGALGSRYDQVAFRFPLDCHDEGNGALRLLPGTHLKSKGEIAQRMKDVFGGSESEWHGMLFGSHPDQVELFPKPGQMLIWDPNIWHSTGPNRTGNRRRSLTWIYFPRNGRFRDHNTLNYVASEQIKNWPSERKRLWGF
jgi:hypothetical protein